MADRCVARAKTSGEQCRRAPIAGATVCRVHGGAAGQVRAAAARRLAVVAVEKDAKAILAHEGFEPVGDLNELLGTLVTEARAFMLAWAARMNDLTSVRFTASGAGTEQLRSEVVLYERAADRTAALAATLVKLGYEDRRTRVLERDADAVEALCRGLIAGLGFDWGDARVQSEWTRQLRLVGGGSS